METHETIRLRVGQAHEVELPGLGTSGYVWRVASEPGPFLTVEKEVRAGEPGNRGAGASASEVFRIRAVEPGETQVRLVQNRPWERDVSPLNEHTLDVSVEPAEG